MRERRTQISAIVTTLLVLASIPWHVHLGLGTDQSWGLTMSERLLDGEVLYRDIVHTNPPLNAWMNAPAVLVARWTGLSPELILYARGYLVVGVGIALTALALARSTLADRNRLHVLVPVLTYLLLIQVGGEFGQREHLGTALFLPLVVLAARRAAGGAPGPRMAVCVGLCASLLVMLKPHYAIVVAVLAAWVLWRRRDRRVLLSLEWIVTAAVALTYLVLTRLMYPAFYEEVLPLLQETYLSQADPLRSLAFAAGFAAIVSVVMFLIRTGAGPTPLVTALLISSAASWVPFILQAKNWRYHAVPALVFGMAALAIHVATPTPTDREAPLPVRVRLAVVALAWAGLLIPFTWGNRSDPSLLAALDERFGSESPSVATLGAYPDTGFPLTREIGGTFPSRWAHDWHGYGALLVSRDAQAEGRTDEASRMIELAESYRTERLDEIEETDPDVIAIDVGRDLWSGFVLRDPRSDEIFRRYQLLWSDEHLAVYARTEEAGP